MPPENTITNNSKRTLKLTSSFSIAPGQTIEVAPDAMRLFKRPLVKSYASDGSLTLNNSRDKKVMGTGLVQNDSQQSQGQNSSQDEDSNPENEET